MIPRIAALPHARRPLDTGDAQPTRCPQDGALSMSRRAVLRALTAGSALGTASVMFGPDTFARYAFGASAGSGDTVVILSLRGGFDGLAAVAPIGDPYYATHRPDMMVAQSNAVQLNTTFALHPKLAPLKTWWDAGKLAIVTDVGQNDPTRSHFEAMAEMERAAPGSSLRTGWIDRLASARGTTDPINVAQVGSSSAPSSFIGPVGESVIRTIEDFTLYGPNDNQPFAQWGAALNGMHTGAPAQMKLSVSTMLGSLQTVSGLRAGSYTAPAAYPRGDDGNLTTLAKALADTARLIKANLGLRVATVDSGDWDIHENSGINTTTGRTPRKLDELGRALAAFAADLGSDLNRVALVTLSEFGRRVSQNGTDGTDHGHGNMMFVLGGGVDGGKFHGTWSGLAPEQLVDGDLPGRTDYRNVLANLLMTRTETGAAHIASTFPGLTVSPFAIAKTR